MITCAKKSTVSPLIFYLAVETMPDITDVLSDRICNVVMIVGNMDKRSTTMC